MTYCVAITVDEGLVFASDSRTNAGMDQVSTYSKLHSFGVDGDRQIVLLSAGNLATTQGVLARIKQDIRDSAELNLFNVTGLGEVADYVGELVREQASKHAEAVSQAGFSAEVTFIVGGQVGDRSPKSYLVYPQGNYITTSRQTPFLQIGEAKYGKAVLDRIIDPATSLDEAALCALVSLDSTMASNATVGPPIEILCYRRDSLQLENYVCLDADAPYLAEIKRLWNEKIMRAFSELPAIDWDELPAEPPGG